MLLSSKEAARRYYSASPFVTNGAPKVHTIRTPRPDARFYDDNNKWFIHSNDQLKNTIQNTYAKFPILTSFDKKQPRLLVFSVDVAEGRTVTFDSYKNANSPERSQRIQQKSARKDVNKSGDDDSGIKIEHVMASGSLPEFYDFQEIKGRKFCDGGLRSNTPFRELLQAHQSYWKEVMEEEEGEEEEENEIKIPDLEVYVINVHPPKQDTVPSDHDGVKDRVNDIIYSDRTSHYDENMAHLVTYYTKFTLQMKKLAKDAISKVDNETDRADLQKKLEAILTTTSTSKDQRGLHGKYKDLVKGQFE